MRKVSSRLAVFVVVSAVVAIGCGGGSSDQTADSRKIPISTSSDEALAAYLEGRNLFEALRITDSRQHFAAAVQADPNFALAHLALANTAPTATEFFDALDAAVANLDTASTGEGLLIRALDSGVRNRPAEQREDLEALVAAFPEDERAHNALATFLFGQQEWQAAIAEYRAAVAINPDFSQPYNQLGYALRTIGDFTGAEEAFKRYIDLIPDQPNPYDSYAELLMKLGRFDESIASYQSALEIDPNFVASYVGIANNQMFLGQTDAARTTLDTLDEIARTDAERRQACTWKAVSFLYDGDTDAALAELQRRLEIARATDDKVTMSGDLVLIGNVLLEAGRLDGAADAYEQSVSVMETADADDEVKEATRRNQLFNAARVAIARGDVDAASALADDYREAVAALQVRFEVRRTHWLAGLIALAREDYPAAIDELELANQQNPSVLMAEATALLGSGNLDAGREILRRVADFNQLNFNLAFVRDKAKTDLEES